MAGGKHKNRSNKNQGYLAPTEHSESSPKEKKKKKLTALSASKKKLEITDHTH
jgi:hypothetical protein